MDAVLCGEVPAAFHDEAMVLYYLNHEMIKFGAGKYIPRVGNCDTDRNPHENKQWGKGRNYQWGEADSDNKGGKACALTWTGMQGGRDAACDALVWRERCGSRALSCLSSSLNAVLNPYMNDGDRRDLPYRGLRSRLRSRQHGIRPMVENHFGTQGSSRDCEHDGFE